MKSIEVFDPRHGRGWESGLRPGKLVSSLGSHTLVMHIRGVPPKDNDAYLRDILLRYSSDYLLLIVEGASKKLMRELERLLPRDNHDRGLYVRILPYSADDANRAIECLVAHSKHEYWICALVREEALQDLESVDFAADLFSWQHVWENLRLFDLAVLYNLEAGEIEVCFRFSGKFDDMITFTESYPYIQNEA